MRLKLSISFGLIETHAYVAAMGSGDFGKFLKKKKKKKIHQQIRAKHYNELTQLATAGTPIAIGAEHWGFKNRYKRLEKTASSRVMESIGGTVMGP